MDCSKTRDARIAARLCIKCGSERTGDGATNRCCAVCADKNRQYNREEYVRTNGAADKAHHKKQYTERKEAGLCPTCGGKRTAKEQHAGQVFCTRCLVKKRRHKDAYRRRQRQHTMWGEGRNGDPLPVGKGALRIGVVKTFRIGADPQTLWAIEKLKKMDVEARMKKNGGVLVGTGFQLCRILREAIQYWEMRRAAPVRDVKFRTIVDVYFGLTVDARTLAIIERHAQHRGGNRSATICDLLIASADRPTWLIATAPRRLPNI